MEEEVKGLGDYFDAVRRYKYLVITVSVILMLLSAAVAYLLPASYKSEGVILIESQEIPRDLIKSTVTSYADQRIEIIKQRTMTTSNVLNIVDKFGLYKKERMQAPPSEIVDVFRENISIAMVEANVTDPNSGRARKASIAFKIAFYGESPQVAQKVANELVTRFLEENVRTRTERANETTSFLNAEANKFQKKIQDLESAIAIFKDKYSDSLPELLEYNLSAVERLQSELVSNQNQISLSKDQIMTLTMEQSNLRYYASPSSSNVVSTPAEMELQNARSDYSRLQARYSSTHPDVVRLKRHITNLEDELGIESDGGESEAELLVAENRLVQLKQRYASSHPDVKSLVKRISILKEQVSSSPKKTSSNVKLRSNPLYNQIRAKIVATEREVSRLQNRQVEIKAQIAEYERRIVQTHQVQRQYTDLTRDYENNSSKYRELKSKQLEAELAQNLESENKGESFTLIEPPLVSSKPEKPNRPKILALGVVGSIGSGVGLALLIDMLFGGVRGYSAFSRVIGQAPLVVIPVITTAQDLSSRSRNKKRIILGVGILFILTITGFHFLVMNLEVFWFKFLRKISSL